MAFDTAQSTRNRRKIVSKLIITRQAKTHTVLYSFVYESTGAIFRRRRTANNRLFGRIPLMISRVFVGRSGCRIRRYSTGVRHYTRTRHRYNETAEACAPLSSIKTRSRRSSVKEFEGIIKKE